MSLNKRIKLDQLNTENVTALYISSDIISGYNPVSNSYDNHYLKYSNNVNNNIQAKYGIDVSSLTVKEILGNTGEIIVDYNGTDVIALLVFPAEYTVDRVNQNGEGIFIDGASERIGLFAVDASSFTEDKITNDRRSLILDNSGEEVIAEFLYSLSGNIFA
jgi:hypothetical protein